MPRQNGHLSNMTYHAREKIRFRDLSSPLFIRRSSILRATCSNPRPLQASSGQSAPPLHQHHLGSNEAFGLFGPRGEDSAGGLRIHDMRCLEWLWRRRRRRRHGPGVGERAPHCHWISCGALAQAAGGGDGVFGTQVPRCLSFLNPRFCFLFLHRCIRQGLSTNKMGKLEPCS